MQILQNRLNLQRVLGTGFGSNQQIIWRLQTDEIVYIVNNIVVFYSPRLNRQSRLIQRPSPVLSISFDRQGNHLAIAEATTISVHDLSDEPDLCRVCTLSSITDDYYVAVRLFPDCSTLLAISTAKSCNVRIWDWRSGQLLASATSSYSIVCLELGVDQTSFVTGGDKSVSIWHFDKTEAEGAIQETTLKTIAACNAGLLDDATFVSACLGKGKSSSHVFTLTSKAVLCRFNLERKTLEKWVDLKLENGFDIAINDDFIAIAGTGGRIRLFTPDTIAHIATISSDTITAETLSIAFNRDHSKIACLYSNSTLAIWDAKRHRLVRQLGFHSGTVFDIISFKNDGFISCCSDGQVRKWSENGDDEIVYEFEHGTYPTAIAKSREERQIAIADCKGTLRLWHRSIMSGELNLVSTVISAHNGPILSADFNLDATLLCSGGQDESIRMFNVDLQLTPIGTFMDHRAAVDLVRFVSSSEYLVSVSSDGTYVRDVSSLSMDSAQFLPELVAPFVSVPNGSQFGVSVDRSGRAAIWNVTTRQVLRYIGDDIQDISVHPSGALIALFRSDYQISIMDWFSCETLSTVCSASPNAKIRFAADGRRMFSFGDDSCILVWQAGHELNQLIDERLQETASEQLALVPVPAPEENEDYFSDESFIEFSEDEYSDGTVYTIPGMSPGRTSMKSLKTIEQEEARAESPIKVESSPRRTSFANPDRRTCWRSIQRSLSPLRQSRIVQRRFHSISPSRKVKAINEVAADLKSAFVAAKETYNHMSKAGEDTQSLLALFTEIRSEICALITPDTTNSGLATLAATLDPESTKSALDTYSGKLIELIQSKVEEALTASIGSSLSVYNR